MTKLKGAGTTVIVTPQMIPYSYPEDKPACSNTTTVTTHPSPSASNTAMVPHAGRSINPYSVEAIGALQIEAMAMKPCHRRRRRRRIAITACSTVLVGGITLGLIGTIAGGIGEAVATRGVRMHLEKSARIVVSKNKLLRYCSFFRDHNGFYVDFILHEHLAKLFLGSVRLN
jgi:hypothetical protein